MKKTFLKKLLILILVLVTMLAACCFMISCDPDKTETINSYEYTTDTFIYSERYNSSSTIYDVNKATTDYASYYFDEKIGETSRNSFVTYAEQLFENLKPEGLSDGELVFFVSNDIKTPRAENGYENEADMAYFSISDIKKIEFIHCVLQALNTNTLNYGLLYGVSSQIYVDLKWGQAETIGESEIEEFLKEAENRFVLDLTYPVFHNKFSSVTQIKYAKSISVRIVEHIESTHGNSAIRQLYAADLTFDLAFDNLFYGYLNEWLNKMQIAEVVPNAEVLKCVPYSSEFSFRLLTYSCDHYFDKDWVEIALTAATYAYKDFNFCYATIKDFLLESEVSFAQVRDFFSYDDNDYANYAKVPVVVQNSDNYGGLAYSNYFYLSSLSSLVHEYAHIASFYKCGEQKSWMTEPIAEYCKSAFTDIPHNVYFAIYNDIEGYERVEGEMDELSRHAVLNLMSKSANPNYYLRFLEGYFYALLFESNRNLHEEFDNYITNYSRTFGLVLGDYLVTTYGKEKFVDLYKRNGNLENVYSKSKNELIDEYLEYLYNIFN